MINQNNRHLIKITAVSISLALLVTIIWLRFFPAYEQFEDINFAHVPTVDYCVLKNSPRGYDGKIIRLKTRLHPNDSHGWYLTDANCQGEGDQSSTAITFYEPKSEELVSYFRKFQKSRPFVAILETTVVGRFSYKNFIGRDDGMNERTHLQFEIHTVEFVAAP